MTERINLLGRSTTTIHFTFDIGNWQWRIACMPNMLELHKTIYHPAYQRSDDPRAVNCPQCMATAEFKRKQEAVDGAQRSRQSRGT